MTDTTTEKPKLIVPIKGEHVTKALLEARENQDTIRQAELRWLQDNNSFLRVHITNLYAQAIVRPNLGKERADFLLLGCAIGSRAVHYCTGEGEAYAIARATSARNINEDLRMSEAARYGKPLPPDPWGTPERLEQIFEDSELIAAMMSIGIDRVRDAAAVTIGTLCLSELPKQAPPVTYR